MPRKELKRNPPGSRRELCKNRVRRTGACMLPCTRRCTSCAVQRLALVRMRVSEKERGGEREALAISFFLSKRAGGKWRHARSLSSRWLALALTHSLSLTPSLSLPPSLALCLERHSRALTFERRGRVVSHADRAGPRRHTPARAHTDKGAPRGGRRNLVRRCMQLGVLRHGGANWPPVGCGEGA